MTLRSVAFAVLLVLAMALGVAGGLGIGYSVFRPQTALAESRLDEQQARGAELAGHVATRDLRIEELLADVAGVREELALLTVERESIVADLEEQQVAADEALDKALKDGSEARDSLASSDDALSDVRTKITTLVQDLESEEEKLSDLRDSVNLMGADRLLLVELRKDMPTDEEEAKSYWEDVRALAAQSDPALAAKVNRVLRLVPAYFEWLETPFTTSCGSVDAFFNSGASELGIVRADLEKDVLLVLINRIDTALGRAIE